jgi:anti-sigma B factor antagonist
MAASTPADRPVARETAYRGGDGLAPGADEVGQALVAKWQRHDDSVAVDAAPALGEMPECQQEAIVDALMVRDRERDGEVVSPPGAPVEQLQPELRPGDDAEDEPVVEDGQPAWLEDRPPDLRPDVGTLVVPPPRTHDVAVPDELDAATAQHVDCAAEQTVDDQEAAMVGGRLERSRCVPLTGRQALDACERLVTRPLEFALVEQVGEVGVGVDDADDVLPRPHTGSVPVTGPERARRRADVVTPTRAAATSDEPSTVRPPVSRRTRGQREGAPHAVAHHRGRAVTAGPPRAFGVEDAGLSGAPGVALHGEVDISAVEALVEALDAAIRDSSGAFVIDLCDLEFLDSSGLSVLMRARALLGREERALAVVCPPGPVRRLFEVAGVIDLLSVYSLREEAAAALVPTD